MPSRLRALATLVALTLSGAGLVQASAPATLVPTRGARLVAALVGVNKAGQATFKISENDQPAGQGKGEVGPRTVALGEVVSWGALVEPARGIQVLLAGGGLIVAEAVQAKNERLLIESGLLGDREVPLEFLAGIVFQPPLDLQDRDRLLARVRDSDARSDRLILENGDELAGTVAEVGEKLVTFDTQGQKLPVEVARIAAIAFDPSLAAQVKPKGPRTLVGFRDGSRLLATQLIVAEGKVELTLADKAVWTLPADALEYLQPLKGKAVYLSDLAADSYRHLPFLNQSWPYRNDLNVLGTQLRAGGRPYAKGLGMHSAARLTYRLDKRYRTFEADVALDDHVGSGGAAVFVVYADDKLAWKSDCLRGGMPPVPVKVDVSGAKRLSLLVEFAERGDELDRGDWLDARLIE